MFATLLGRALCLVLAGSALGLAVNAARPDGVVDQPRDRGLVALGERLRIGVRRRLHVVVQVAVAEVTEVDHANAGKAALEVRVGDGDELLDRRHRQRDVVLDVAALGDLRERDRLADVPHRVRMLEARRDRDVGDEAALERVAEQRLERRLGGRNLGL